MYNVPKCLVNFAIWWTYVVYFRTIITQTFSHAEKFVPMHCVEVFVGVDLPIKAWTEK